MDNTNLNSAIRICWLREDKPDSATLTILPTSPLWLPAILRQLTGEDMLAGGLPDLSGVSEIHLPFLDRRDWPGRAGILPNARFHRCGALLLPDPGTTSPGERNGYHGRFMAAAAFAAETIYGAWRAAPEESSTLYFPAHAPVSLAVQRVLRDHAAARWLANLENCANWADSICVLAYIATPPYRGRPRTDFAYDVQKPKWFELAFRGGKRPFAEVLWRVRDALTAAGRADLACRYDPEQAGSILREVRQNPQRLELMLSSEEAIVNRLLQFGAAIREAASQRGAVRCAPSFVHSLEVRLRRMMRDENLDHLVPLLFNVATHALAVSTGHSYSVPLAIAGLDGAIPANEGAGRPRIAA